MSELQWKVQSVNHTLLQQGGSESAYVVTLTAVPGATVISGQLVRRLSAPPAYAPGDVLGDAMGGDQADDGLAAAKGAAAARPKEGAPGAPAKKGGGAS